MQQQIIGEIISEPSNYETLINNASYEELKAVFIQYQKNYLEDPVSTISFYENEEGLRNKLLGCSSTVISTLIANFKKYY